MNQISRRKLLKSGVAAVKGAIAIPFFIPCGVLASGGKPGANERITVGIIGVGHRARLLMDQLPEQAQIASLADCFIQRCKMPCRYANDRSTMSNDTRWRVYQDYRKMIDEKDIDAVIVATPDHARARICVHACQAGKDIYAEKPLTLYIREGRVLVNAVRKYKRILQVGSQQRSMAINQVACDFVRNGGIGQVRKVQAVNFSSSSRIPDLPADPVPESLDWDMWLNQAELRHYNEQLYEGWRSWWDYSGGEITNMGAHAFDQVQWALGMDDTGPVEFWPVTTGQNGKASFKYASGIVVDAELENTGPDCGAIFTGTKGKIEINRNKLTTNPVHLVADLPPEAEIAKWRDKTGLWQAKYHLENWLDCIKTRKTPNTDVEIGHRSASVCHLINISREMGRKIKWDPEKERAVDDDEANQLVDRPRRKGYGLPELV